MNIRKQINLVKKMGNPLGKLQAAQGQFVSDNPADIERENLSKELARAVYAIDMAADHSDFPSSEVAKMKEVLLEFGLRLAREWCAKRPELFQQAADFLTAKRDHKPEPMEKWKVRVAVIYMDGLARSIKNILDHLSGHGIAVPKSGKARQNFQRQVRDFCKEHNFRIAGGKRGAPKKNK